MLNGKVMIVHLTAGLIKKTYHNFTDCNGSKFSPKPYEAFGGDKVVKVDLSNYATKQISKIFLMLIIQALH